MTSVTWNWPAEAVIGKPGYSAPDQDRVLEAAELAPFQQVHVHVVRQGPGERPAGENLDDVRRLEIRLGLAGGIRLGVGLHPHGKGNVTLQNQQGIAGPDRVAGSLTRCHAVSVPGKLFAEGREPRNGVVTELAAYPVAPGERGNGSGRRRGKPRRKKHDEEGAHGARGYSRRV